MKLHYLIIVALFLQFTGCGKILDKLTNKESKTVPTEQTDLQKKEKELELKERELALEKEKMNLEKEKGTTQGAENSGSQQREERNVSRINLNDFATLWFGTIKDGTNWEVSISGFDGVNFRGRNTVYWKSTPEGFSTNFTGTVDDVSGKVVMYEDKKAKGSGVFTGTINRAGTRMSGSWSRYSDGGTFKWNIERMEKGAQ
jgi:hypothetical protein